jgi:SAM-dependent methyltransferase
MREAALEFLACPACGAGLELQASARDGEHITSGILKCAAEGTAFPIRDGVPRFAKDVAAIEDRTADAFGYEWTRYRELAGHYRQQFLDWIRPVQPQFFAGKAVLEGGCGKGRHSALAAEFGARAVVAIDLSQAVDSAFANTKHMPAVHVVQADLKKPPVRRVFDYAFSVGVLHHLPAPEDGFRALVARVRPGGAISAWVYGREGNGWIVYGVTPVREAVTSRLPHGIVDVVAGAMTVPLFAATRLVYGPTQGKLLGRKLPYGEYLAYIAPFPFREQRSIVFDHLIAPVAHYLRRDEFGSWFDRAKLEEVRIEHHNGNSWRGFARVPSAA